MVFIYILFVKHETKFGKEDVLFIELVLGIINGTYWEHLFGVCDSWNSLSIVSICPTVSYIYLWYQVYLFSRQLYLDGRTSLEGIIQSSPVAV